MSNEQKTQTQSGSETALNPSTLADLATNKPIFSQLNTPRPAVMSGAQAQAQSAVLAAQRDTEEFVELEHKLEAATTVLIPEGVTFKGTIETAGKAGVFVKGELIGNIIAGDKPVYVNQGARVVGMIECDADIYVAGTVTSGNSGESQVCVKTPNRFVLAGTGRVDGDVAYGAIRIYGGVVSGRLMPNDKTIR